MFLQVYTPNLNVFFCMQPFRLVGPDCNSNLPKLHHSGGDHPNPAQVEMILCFHWSSGFEWGGFNRVPRNLARPRILEVLYLLNQSTWVKSSRSCYTRFEKQNEVLVASFKVWTWMTLRTFFPSSVIPGKKKRLFGVVIASECWILVCATF